MKPGKHARLMQYMERFPDAHRDDISKYTYVSRNGVTRLLQSLGYEQIGASGFYKKSTS
jgi:hypothetical protein